MDNPAPPESPRNDASRTGAGGAGAARAQAGALGIARRARVPRALLWTLAFVLTALLIFGAWTVYADDRARSHAEALCMAVAPGQPEEGLMQRALDAGADPVLTRWVQPMIGPRWLAAAFKGWRPGVRHLCVITVVDGKVKEGRYERGN